MMDTCIKEDCPFESVLNIREIKDFILYVFGKIEYDRIQFKIYICNRHFVFHYCDNSECLLDDVGTCMISGIDQCGLECNNFGVGEQTLKGKRKVSYSFIPRKKLKTWIKGNDTLANSNVTVEEVPESFISIILGNISSGTNNIFNDRNEQFLVVLHKMFSAFVRYCEINISENDTWKKNPSRRIADAKKHWITHIINIINETAMGSSYLRYKRYSNPSINWSMDKIIHKHLIPLLSHLTYNGGGDGWWGKKKPSISNL